MLKLIYKDLRLTCNKKVILYLLWGIIIAIVFSEFLTPSAAYTLGASLIAYFLSLYPAGYDVMGGDILINSFPVKRRNVVIAQYIEMIIFIAIGYGLIFVSSAALKPISFGFIKEYAGFDVLIYTFLIISVLYSINLPVNYLLGRTGSTIVTTTLFILFSTGPALIMNFIKNNPQNVFTKWLLQVFVSASKISDIKWFIISIIIYIVSMIISVIIYENKDMEI